MAASRIRSVLEVSICLVCGLLTVGSVAADSSVMADPAFNPWAVPLLYCAAHPDRYDIDLDMGFVNTDYACHINAVTGVEFDTQARQSDNADAARWVLSAINRCQGVQKFRLQTGVSRDSVSDLHALVPTVPAADIRIGRHHGRWEAPETHAKVFQLAAPQSDLFFTVHGSLNLQTVGLCCKANNALRFVEAAPAKLYDYFHQLGDAVAANSAVSLFDGQGSVDSSGVDLPEVAIGGYRVRFYAGRAQGFVGERENDAALPWPTYLNPPVAGRHAPGVVHWYDGVLYEAARQLQLGREVRLDVLMFEIGRDSAFVNHLWRFIQEGFVGGVSVDGDDAGGAPIRGQLHVRFLWQFQSHPKPNGETSRNLNTWTVIDTPGMAGGYHLRTGRIWSIINAHGQVLPPTTPYDMHNKVVLMSVPEASEENRIFVASSNLDAPGVGSGRLWQAGTVIRAVIPQPVDTADQPASLFQAYQSYFNHLWRNRQGQHNAGQVQFYEELTPLHLAGRVNWLETTSPDAAVGLKVRPGIDGFFFPVPSRAP